MLSFHIIPIPTDLQAGHNRRMRHTFSVRIQDGGHWQSENKIIKLYKQGAGMGTGEG